MKKTEISQTSNAEMVTISRAEYEKLQAQSKRVSEIESRVDVLMEALRLARHKQFGASSEKSEETLMEQLSFLFNEAEVFSAAEKEETESVTVVATHKRHKKHEYTLDNIPEGIETKQVEHHPRQLCYTGSHCPYHDPEIRYGQPAVSAGAGN